MKLKITFVFFLFSCFSSVLFAQSKLPTITWPYQFDEFKSGTLHYANAVVPSQGRFNIHLKDNVLQYFNDGDGRVHKAETKFLDYLEIDSTHYVLADGQMMQELYSHDDIKLLLCKKADWDALFNYQGAAYGMNITTSASMATHPFDLAGLDRPLYTTLVAQKYDGRWIKVHGHYYISKAGTLAKANKKNLQQSFSLDAKDFKAFLKKNKIDWQSSESLKQVVDYISLSNIKD